MMTSTTNSSGSEKPRRRRKESSFILEALSKNVDENKVIPSMVGKQVFQGLLHSKQHDFNILINRLLNN